MPSTSLLARISHAKRAPLAPSGPHRFLFALALILLLPAPLLAQSPQLGDIDADQVPTVRDIALIVEHMKGAAPLSQVKAEQADINRDGFVNDADISELIKEILQTRTPESLPLASVEYTSPHVGEGNVAVTRETIVHFTIPLALDTVIDSNSFYAEFGGRKILCRADISSDRHKATLFYLEPLPSSAQIKVTLKSAGLRDLINRPFDGDGDGLAGGDWTGTFTTLSITAVAGTSISGRVFASERATGGMDVPLAGVTITVDGAEETLRAVTDGLGNFTLSPCPAGSFFVQIDGRTSGQSSYPQGSYYPTVGKQWDATAGRTDNLAGSSSDTTRGTIYLPLIRPNTLQTVSQTQSTPIEFPASVLADNPALAGTRIEVPANSLSSDNGTRGGRVGLAPVAPDRIPSPLPPGLNLPMVITVQTDGGTNFERPVPVTFPNLPDPVTGIKKAPGEKSALWSFNHDTGQWEVVGPMTVSEDGNFVTTDAGVGILQPGWHGDQRGGLVIKGCSKKQKLSPVKCAPETSWIDWNFVSKKEGSQRTEFYFPGDCQLEKFRKSGITVATGVDLGQRHPSEIRQLEISKELADKLVDYAFPLRGCAAQNSFNNSQIPDLTKSEADELDEAVKREILGRMIKSYSTSSRTEFCNIPRSAQTILASLAWHFGASFGTSSNSSNNMKTLWLAALEGEWSLVASLLKSENEFKSRRLQESNYLLEGILLDQLPDEIDPCDGRFYLLNYNVSEENLTQPNSRTKNIVESYTLSYSNRSTYYRVFRRDSGESVISGISHDGMVLTKNLILGNGNYSIYFANSDNYFGYADFDIGTNNDLRYSIGSIVGRKTSGLDVDEDLLVDFIEQIIGTNPENSDSDEDGINDGIELKQGTNPLDGLISLTGIVATSPTATHSLDIESLDNVVISANGLGGINIFNILNGLTPTRVAAVDTKGTAVDISYSGGLIAVADYQEGLAVVDMTEITNTRVIRQINVGSPATCVVASGPVAYVGTLDGRVVTVDLYSGKVLWTINVGNSVQDLAISGDVLYALRINGLNSISLLPDVPTGVSGSMSLNNSLVSTRRLRLNVGPGVLYAAHGRGWNVLNIATNPLQPTLLQSHSTPQFGFKQMVATGSGLGVAAAGANSSDNGPHEVDLYDLGANGRGNTFITTFTTPGIAEAVSIYNGLAYVADGSEGLQVINYKAYDTLKQPPTITLSSNVALPNGLVEDGKLVRLTAAVTDDVQVREVEFYLDGERVVTDGNFPFEQRLVAPRRTSTKTNFLVKARAIDTGGNSTWTPEYLLNIVADQVPPRITTISQNDAAMVPSLDELSFRFSELIDASTLASGIQLTEAGPDGVFGTADDVIIAINIEFVESTFTARLIPLTPLAPGRYRLTVSAPLADAGGTPFAGSYISNFRIFTLQDSDGDGLPDDWEDVLGLNPLVADTDGDGTRDGLEDFDNDGLPDGIEITLLQMDPRVADQNQNGIKDGNDDSDLDGLSDGTEALAGTNTRNSDTDGDGLDDNTEILVGLNPLQPDPALQATALSLPAAAINTTSEVTPIIPTSTNSSPVSFKNQ